MANIAARSAITRGAGSGCALLFACLAGTLQPCASAMAAEGGATRLDGVWQVAHYQPRLVPADGAAVPFTPAGLARYQANVAALKRNPQADPAQANCLPQGTPHSLVGPYPFEIDQSGEQLVFLHEANRQFRIVLLQKAHNDPELWDPSYMGDGIGHWDHDALVIDSSNFLDETWLDDAGLPHSDQLHTLERLRLLKGGQQLEARVTIEDPATFTRPWSARLLFERRPDITLATDWVCGEAHRKLAPRPTSAARETRASSDQPVSAAHQALAGFWREDRAPPPGSPPTGRPPTPPGGPATLVRAAAMGHLQPWVEQRYATFNAMRAKGEELATRGISCLPWALPGIGLPGGASYGMDILVTPERVVVLYQLDHQFHIVHLGQSHPEPSRPSYFGHSVGHWEGDTLVVDSTGFNAKTDVYYGISHTEALHIVERLRVVDGFLENRVTFEDPGAFTSPFSYVQDFLHRDPMQEYVCAQNNVDGGGPPVP